jgi:NAD-dependent dihydropyrimidine dehydrogenase PreA subunit
MMAWLTGYPREKVNWHPIIDLSKCVKCGLCMNCGKGVFTWTTQGPVVDNPNDCVVGCTTCGNLCEGNAITFPDINELRALYKKEHLWAKVTRQMRESGKLTPKE